MKRFIFLIALFFFASHAVYAQETSASEQTHTRPRIVGPSAREENQTEAKPAADSVQKNVPTSTPTPAAMATPQPSPSKGASATSGALSTSVDSSSASSAPAIPYVPLQPIRPLPAVKARAKISEAQKMMRSRLTLTAATSPSLELVTIAALDQDTSELHLVTLPKQTFLVRGTDVALTTSKGLIVRLQIVRSNYVNTAVVISDMQGKQLTPLVVEYPIEKFGRFREMAYYTSAHPALVAPDVVKRGQQYVRTMLDLASKRLKDKGKVISPELVDIAERLCVVEHVDHDRFRREDRATLYNEVYALFALNELDTYRYSVSSAGAGGMVQMIPSTYAMIRRLHPGVGLNPDFVSGMRNHGNALEAMLLHMQDNWNDLALNADVLEAMKNNYATQTELVASGYNSNSARLPGYIRRGGSAWKSLIPRETQMYLQIYKSFESLVSLKLRGEDPE